MDNFVVEYFDEIETEFENTLFYLVYQGPSWVQIMKKLEVDNLVSVSRDHLHGVQHTVEIISAA